VPWHWVQVTLPSLPHRVQFSDRRPRPLHAEQVLVLRRVRPLMRLVRVVRPRPLQREQVDSVRPSPLQG